MNVERKKVAVFTGNRAEYGLQVPTLRAIDAHPDLECQLVVSGAHLDKAFGNTIEEIKADGFTVHSQIKIDPSGNDDVSTANAIGTGVLSASKALDDLKPDMMVVYGDRFEAFAAVIAATQMNIPTAHIEGGDLTEGGALDDSVRHSVTKLAHLHFTTNDQATNRVLGMGEEPWRVHTVGLPAIDMIEAGNYASEKEVIEKLELDLSRPVILFTQHAVTTEFEHAYSQISPSINALRKFGSEGTQIILTYPNSDTGGKTIIEALRQFAAEDLPKVQLHQSLGRHLYHGALALALNNSNRIACVGNSSSGIKETPFFGCPTVNIGSRQQGRLRGANVLEANYDEIDIGSQVEKCLFDGAFRHSCNEANNPYYLGGAGRKIAEIIANAPCRTTLLRKGMTLQGEENSGWYR